MNISKKTQVYCTICKYYANLCFKFKHRQIEELRTFHFLRMIIWTAICIAEFNNRLPVSLSLELTLNTEVPNGAASETEMLYES